MDKPELVLKIISELYPDEQISAPVLSLRIDVTKSRMNSVLYELKDSAFLIVGHRGTRPLWSNTQEANDLYREINPDISGLEGSMFNDVTFCDAWLEDMNMTCNKLIVRSYCTRPGCPNNEERPGSRYVPPEINGGENGLPGWYGINFQYKTSQERTKEDIMAFICEDFWTPENAKNHSYVNSYGEPGTKKRKNKLIDHFGGINVPASAEVQQRRKEIIAWLYGLELDFC